MPTANVFVIMTIVLLTTNALIWILSMRYLGQSTDDTRLKVENMSIIAACLSVLYLALLAASAIGLAFPPK